MEIAFDPDKNAANKAKHGLDFVDAYALNWGEALIVPDTRREYGEKRFRAFVYGVDGEGPYSVAFTVRGGVVRLISFRRARPKERKLYDERS